MANKYKEHSKVSRSEFFKRVYKPHSQNCAKKRAFDTEDIAQQFLKTHNYTGTQYRCPHCYMWHNTTH